MNKVWYRNDGQLEVDVIADRTAALRRGASIASDKVGTPLTFVGIEDDDGKMLSLAEFDSYVRGYRLRDLASEPTVCVKYYVDVQPPAGVRKSAGDEWVRYAIENTRVRADKKAFEAADAFGSERVRVRGAHTKTQTASV